MPWTRSQSKLRDISLEMPRRGMSVLIALCNHHSGVSQIVEKIVQHTARAKTDVRAYSVFSGESHNTVWEFANLTQATGKNFSDVIRNALRGVSNQNAHGVTIFLKETQMFKPRDLEKLLRATEHEACALNIRLRLILLQRPVERWMQPAKGVGLWREGWPQLPAFLNRRHQFRSLEYIEVTREGLEELRGKDLPAELFENELRRDHEVAHEKIAKSA